MLERRTAEIRRLIGRRKPLEPPIGAVQSSDKSLDDIGDDLLERVEFAHALAMQLDSPHPAHGYVMGLIGPWGSGKSTLMTFTAKHLAPEDIVVHFNPWLYGDINELVARFLKDVRLALPRLRYWRVRASLAQYAGLLTTVGSLGFLTPGLPIAAAVGALIGRLFGRVETPEKQRDRVRKALKKLKGRLVVFIDDVDRLAPTEVAEIFRLVKLVGDFPRTSYRVAYDAGHVEAALDNALEREGAGRDYMEKVVQATREVPHVPESRMAEILRQEVDAALVHADIAPLAEDVRWPVVSAAIVAPLTRNIRDVRRFTNVLPTALHLTDADVNAVDVAALEALRIKMPDFHAALAAAAPTLTRHQFPDFMMPGLREKDREAIAKLTEQPDARSRAVGTATIRRLFPAASYHLDDGGEDVAAAPEIWRKERRVATRSALMTYLSKAVGTDTVSAADTDEALSKFGDPAEFGELAKSFTARQSLELLRDIAARADELDSAPTAMCIATLANLHDRIPYDGRGALDPELGGIVMPLAHRLIDRDPNGLPDQDLEGAFATTTSLSAKYRFIQLVGRAKEDVADDEEITTDSEDSGQEPFVSPAVETLKRQLEQQLLRATPADLLEEHAFDELFIVLVEEGGEAGATRIRTLVGHYAFLLRALRHYAVHVTHSDGEQTTNYLRKLRYEAFANVVGETELDASVRRLHEFVDLDVLEERDRAVLDAAIQYANGNPPPINDW